MMIKYFSGTASGDSQFQKYFLKIPVLKTLKKTSISFKYLKNISKAEPWETKKMKLNPLTVFSLLVMFY